MSRIEQTFAKLKEQNRSALVTFIMAGDPSLENSAKVLTGLPDAGADIIEIGMPFTDPAADGLTIQLAGQRALAAGANMKHTLSMVTSFRQGNNNTPIVLMGYANPIFSYGYDQFVKDAKAAGVDGLIVVDLPWPENKNFSKKCKKNSINFVQLVSPTTSSYRMKRIINDSHDMIYYISMLSTTGGKLKVSPKEILKNYNKIKKINKSKNLVIGFGITLKTISSLKRADGLVVGSALCKEISKSIKNKQNPVTKLGNMVKRLKTKLS